jgi:hypothetical protein
MQKQIKNMMIGRNALNTRKTGEKRMKKQMEQEGIKRTQLIRTKRERKK